MFFTHGSQRPPAKPEACRRGSGSKPRGPSGSDPTPSTFPAPGGFGSPPTTVLSAIPLAATRAGRSSQPPPVRGSTLRCSTFPHRTTATSAEDIPGTVKLREPPRQSRGSPVHLVTTSLALNVKYELLLPNKASGQIVRKSAQSRPMHLATVAAEIWLERGERVRAGHTGGHTCYQGARNRLCCYCRCLHGRNAEDRINHKLLCGSGESLWDFQCLYIVRQSVAIECLSNHNVCRLNITVLVRTLD